MDSVKAGCRLLAMWMMLAYGGNASACQCEPGSLAYEDAFFKYCEPWRAAYGAGKEAASGGAASGEKRARPEPVVKRWPGVIVVREPGADAAPAFSALDGAGAVTHPLAP